MFMTLVALGPLVRPFGATAERGPSKFGLAELPG
jgi:hypothetical protein